jgi:hypothetical protein
MIVGLMEIISILRNWNPMNDSDLAMSKFKLLSSFFSAYEFLQKSGHFNMFDIIQYCFESLREIMPHAITSEIHLRLTDVICDTLFILIPKYVDIVANDEIFLTILNEVRFSVSCFFLC